MINKISVQSLVSSRRLSIHLDAETSRCRPAMPLFQASGGGPAHAKPAGRTVKKFKFRGTCGKTDEDGAVYSLTRLSLLSLADNMKDVWVKDYADNYMDHYSFRYIMGPFNLLRESVGAYLTDIIICFVSGLYIKCPSLDQHDRK